MAKIGENVITTKMALNILSYLNIFIILVIFKLTSAATNYLTENTVNPHESSPTIYSQIPQQYLLAYQKYIPPAKYIVPRPETQAIIPVTEKTAFSPSYKVPVDNSKYVTSQVTKLGNANQVSYPYLYSLTKAASPTEATYPSTSSIGSDIDYEKEIPKKYHYGYRVSNPHTGTEFGHSEVNDGLSAKGYYHVLLPDGRLQNVKYWAGPSGYHATITYETQF